MILSKKIPFLENFCDKYVHSSLFLAIMMLMGIGLVQVYSSSFIFAQDTYGDGLFFFKKQFVFTILSFLVLLVTSRLKMSFICQWGWILWPLALSLLIMTFIPGVGIRAGGALRWIELPFGLRFEPSELLKVAFCVWLTSIIYKKHNPLKNIPFWALLLMTILPLLLLLKQPDFGTFIIIVCVAYVLLFVHGISFKYLLLTVLPLIPLFYLLVMKVPYRRDRMMAFLDPWSDPAQIGFQVIQSMLSFHSGGLTGAGLGQGQGKLFFLPEAHTDFTFAVYGEEMGFLGVLCLVFLYALIVYRGLKLSIIVKDAFARTMALGLIVTFGLSVFINMSVVLGLLPTKGLTLPFLSYGGSSLLVSSFLFGLILSIEKEQGTIK